MVREEKEKEKEKEKGEERKDLISTPPSPCQGGVAEFVEKVAVLLKKSRERERKDGGEGERDTVEIEIAEVFHQTDFVSLLKSGQLKKYLHFNAHRYSRNLIASDETFSLFLMCWEKNQKTPIHDHGNSGVQVWCHTIEGSLSIQSGMVSSKTSGVLTSADVTFSSCHVINAGDPVFLMDDSLSYHTTSNTSAGRSISLHLYSPPYFECRYVDVIGADEKGGVLCSPLLGSVPVVHCETVDHYLREECLAKVVCKVDHVNLFCTFGSLTEILRKEIMIDQAGKHSQVNVDHVKGILQRMDFDPEEILQYAKFSKNAYTRNLIGYDEKYTMLLLCWDVGQKSPIHDHAGSNCWVKVLVGTLRESLYTVNDDGHTVNLVSELDYNEGGVTYIHDRMGIHRMANPHPTQPAYTLHVYSPAYHECHLYDEKGADKRKVSISAAYGSIFPFMEKPLSSSCHITTLKGLQVALTQELSESNPDPRRVFQRMAFEEKIWRQFIHFDPNRYTRNLLVITSSFSLMLICWMPSQHTPVHRHEYIPDRMSSSYVHVLQGELEMQRYVDIDGELVMSDDPPLTIKEDECVLLASQEYDYHQTYNRRDSLCVSLHLYTPPYLDCHFPNKKCTGSTDAQTNSIPVAYCGNLEEAREEEKATCNAVKGSPPLGPPCISSEFGVFHRPKVFTNFFALSHLLELNFSKDFISSSHLTTYLDRMKFNPKEWRQFACACVGKYTRNLVAFGEKYSLYLNYWLPLQASPIHDHSGSQSWVKILEGELTEEIFEVKDGKMEKECTAVHGEGVTKHRDGSIVHRTSNQTDKVVYSLHLYSPPFSECKCYNDVTGSAAVFICDHHIRQMEGEELKKEEGEKEKEKE